MRRTESVPHTGSRSVRLSGWLRNRRDHGGVYFIDLADHYGITQLVVEPGAPCTTLLSALPKETVIRADGKVVARDAGQSQSRHGDRRN
jgi:aspartyl-tRNA synthetase